MGLTKFIDFDYYLNRIKAGGKDVLLENVVRNIVPHCSADIDADMMCDVFNKRAMSGGISVENGIAIFDMTSGLVDKPVTLVATLESQMDYQAPDNKPVDLFVGVISPANNVAAHLQRLSVIARLFRSRNLCKALRGTRSVDEMKVLFMPDQEWMAAA